MKNVANCTIMVLAVAVAACTAMTEENTSTSAGSGPSQYAEGQRENAYRVARGNAAKTEQVARPENEQTTFMSMNQASEPPAVLTATDAGTPKETAGWRALSAAFVRIGADGFLTVELRDGQVAILRDVTMSPHKYCGTQVNGNNRGQKYCGNYSNVAAARAGGGPSIEEPITAVQSESEPSPGSSDLK